ncbi:MAG TPA: FG-GAP-like repeat-containing protein [Opitutus sp.]|nr:FG-GAP-like repeat-containing protein [Opitutus sp.]
MKHPRPATGACLSGWSRFAAGVAFAGLVAAARGGLVEAPLAPRSGPRGPTLFKEMPAAQTGIVTENNFADPKMWTEREKEFALGATGTGVAIGDYDGDGRPDIFVVSKTERCRLFRNLGNWKFEDVTDRAGLPGGEAGWLDTAKSWVGMGDDATADAPERWKQGATFVDVNNDGRLDLYVCRFGAPNWLFINQGDGTFKEEAAARGLALNDASGMAEFCDYDRDGCLDVYIHTTMLNATAYPNGQRDHLFHNEGGGKFVEVTDRAGIGGETIAHSATWWDYDGDGWPDLYVANDFAPLDRLYHNNRDGTFTDVIAQLAPHVPYSAMGADLGDVNNDGRIDLLAADMAATTHEKDQRGIASARELTAGENENAALPQYPHNALLLNTGAGRFLEAAYLAGLSASDWTWSVRLEDLDNDGRLDACMTNGMVREYQNSDLRDRVVRAETAAESRRIMRSSPVFPERNLAFRNRGDLQFEDVSAAWGLDQKAVTFGAAFGDLDGDGDLDLVLANYQAGVTVLRNDSDAGHRVIVALRGLAPSLPAPGPAKGTRSNRFGVGAIVRIETASGVQVRPLVLARGYMSASEPVLHFGLGTDTRIDRLTVAWPGGAIQTFTGLAADRKYTITEEPGADGGEVRREAAEFVNVSAETPWLPKMHESPWGPAQPLAPSRYGRRGPVLAAGDLDGDGKDDFVVGATATEPLRVVVDGKTVSLPTGGASGPVAIFDANGDGANDVLVTKTDAAEVQLWLNGGHGELARAPEELLPRVAISAGAAVVADFDRNGWLDVFLGARIVPDHYPTPPRSTLLANRGGRFEDVTDTVAPGLREVGLVTSALWSDVDGDGWSDLLVATEWGEVRYFHNERGARLEDWTGKAGFAAAGTGWWTALASADFNGDGRPDFVAGNAGLNTPYHADAAHPTLLYYGDFAGRGAPQIVEAYYEGEKVYPRRTAKVLGAEIPAILRRFPRNDLYAHATLEEILGKEPLARARRLAATELRSGVFLSQPDGTYRFEPLPRIAQIAPLQGIVAGDFDGDGQADIYAVQNSFAPIPAIGRFDGGVSQLLRGDGRGHFAAVPPAESGLVVPGDAKALVAADLDGDGWADFVVTRNNDTMVAFRNGRMPGRWSLQVRLRGPAGNPAGIGARIALECRDGSTQSAEVAGGGGYASQSTAVFFGGVEANPAQRIRVRWPDGGRTEEAVPPRAAKITIAR